MALDIADLLEEAARYVEAKQFQYETFSDGLNHITSEVSEAWGHYVNGHEVTEVFYDEKGKPDGVPIELADILIRVVSMCAKYGIDLEAAIITKLNYNWTRPVNHGKPPRTEP